MDCGRCRELHCGRDGDGVTDARITQELVEHWTSNADARATQAFVEHWTNPATGNVRAVLTNIALEHWVGIAPPPSAQPPRAWILA